MANFLRFPKISQASFSTMLDLIVLFFGFLILLHVLRVRYLLGLWAYNKLEVLLNQAA